MEDRTFNWKPFFRKYYNVAKYELGMSDAEPFSLKEVLDMADPECKSLWDNMKLGYSELKGLRLLRKEVGPLHGVSEDDVLICVPQEGVYISMNILPVYLKRRYNLDKIHVIGMNPVYEPLTKTLQYLGCDMDFWQLTLTEGVWKLHLDDLEKLIRLDTKLLVVNFPHNPTGYVPSNDEWQALITLCKSKGIFIFSDEIFRFTNLDGTESIKSASEMCEDSITLYGVPKVMGLAGVRIGWLCCRNKEVMSMLEDYKDYTSVTCPILTEIMGLIAVRNREAIMKRTVSIVNKNLVIFKDFIKEHDDIFEWYPPKAGTVGLIKLKGWLLELGKGSASGLLDMMAREVGLFILPAELFHFKPDEYSRVGLGRKDFPVVLGVLRKFLENHSPVKKVK